MICVCVDEGYTREADRSERVPNLNPLLTLTLNLTLPQAGREPLWPNWATWPLLSRAGDNLCLYSTYRTYRTSQTDELVLS